MPEETLTGKRREILDFIAERLQERGYPPSVREIGEAVGLNSSSTVHAHLATLQRQGFLLRDPTKPRAITVSYDPSSGAALTSRPVRAPDPPRPGGVEPIEPLARRRPPTPGARRRALIRRRLTAIVLAVGVGFVLRPLLLPGGDPLVVPGRVTPAAADAAKRVYVVQSGDTLWSIARQLHPGGDPRPWVDQLAAEVHGASLQAGQRLVLP